MLISCEHHGCVAIVPAKLAARDGWQLTRYGDFCPLHNKVIHPVPPRPKKVIHVNS